MKTYAVEHSFLSFGMLFTTTVATFATREDAAWEAARLTDAYHREYERLGLRLPARPSQYEVVERDNPVP